MLIASASAHAAQVGIGFDSGDIGVPGGYIPEYVAAPGEVNAPTVTADAASSVITFHDPVATLSPEPPEGDPACTLLDEHTAACVLPDPAWIQRFAGFPGSLALLYATTGAIKYLEIDLGDRNDSYVPTVPASVGGTAPPLILKGGAGNDTLTNGPGATGTDAGPGNDFIFARNGIDEFVMCGGGVDHVRSMDAGDDAWTDCEQVAPPG
jgi:Ca2+-binding RTX toxin-like protein